MLELKSFIAISILLVMALSTSRVSSPHFYGFDCLCSRPPVNCCGYVLGHSDRDMQWEIPCWGFAWVIHCWGFALGLCLWSACLLCNDPDLQGLLPGLTSELSHCCEYGSLWSEPDWRSELLAVPSYFHQICSSFIWVLWNWALLVRPMPCLWCYLHFPIFFFSGAGPTCCCLTAAQHFTVQNYFQLLS